MTDKSASDREDYAFLQDTMPDDPAHHEEATGADETVMPDISVEDTVDFLTDFEAHNAGADVRVYKITEGQRTPSFVTNFPVGTKSYINLLKYLQNRYPEGGDFMIHVRAASGTKPFLARRRLRVEGTQRSDSFTEESGLGKLLGDLMRQQEDRFNGMMERLDRRDEELRRRMETTPQANPLDMIRTTLELIKPLVQPVPLAPVQQDPLKQFREQMLFMKAMKDELREELGEPEGDDNVALTLLKNLPQIGEAIQALRGGQPAPAPPALTAPVGKLDGPTPRLPAASAPVTVENPTIVNTDMTSLAPYFDILNAQARDDNDPDVYAQLVIDHTPGDTLAALLARPELLAEIEAAYPAAKPYNDWWSELIDNIKERLAEGDDSNP